MYRVHGGREGDSGLLGRGRDSSLEVQLALLKYIFGKKERKRKKRKKNGKEIKKRLGYAHSEHLACTQICGKGKFLRHILHFETNFHPVVRLPKG